MGKKDKAKPNTVRSSSIETARRDQVNMPSPSESLGSEQVGHADTSEDNNYAEEAREIFDQPVESSKFLNPPGDSIPPEHSISESMNYPTRQVSLFEEPDGFGIIQSWENNPVMEGQDTTSSNDMIEEETIQDAVPPSSSTKESPRQRKKPGKKEAAVTPKKKERWWTWENVKIPSFLYAPELLPTFVDFYESGATVEREGVFGRLIFGCSNLNDAVFCTMKYDDSAISSCVFSVFKYGSTEQEIREMIRELQADCLYKRETGEDRVSQLSLSYLLYFDIKALDHKAVNFPDALYYCELCDYHINNIGHFRDHMRWNGPHIHALEIRKQRFTFVREMPIMLKNQREAINRAIEDICSKETPPLKKIADDVRELLLERLTSIKGLEGREPDLQLMGSVLYDAFNPGSDINFSLQYENVDPSDVLCLIHKIKEHFNETESFKDFSKIEFMDGANGAHPRISMMYHDRISILVSWWATEKVALGKLLKRYTDLHPSIPKLMISIRHWAKLCDLCASYGLVKHGFDIMVIHVLQLRGVIPFITDGVASPCPPDAVDLAVEFVAFFAHYSMKLDTVVQIEQREPMLKKNTKWNNKIFQIKNPVRDDNVVYFPRTFQPYFLNCFLATFIYLAVPRKNNQPIIDVNLMIPDINRKKESERQQQRPVNSSTPAATPRKTNESHDAQAPTKQPVVTAKEPAQPVSDPRLEAHERRWQQEGKRIEEDPVEFLKNQLDQELATPSGKKKNYNRNRTRSKNKAAEQETKVNADFPTTQVNGVNLYQLQAGDVEICGKEVYNRAAFSEVFVAMQDLENDGYVLNREFLKKLSKNKILKRASFRAPHSAYKRYSEVYFSSNVEVEKPILEDAEIRIHKSVEMDSSLEDKMTALSLKNDDQPEVNSSTVLEALEAALPNVSLNVTHEDEKLDVTISVDGEDEEKPAMTEQSQGSEKEEEVVMSIEEPTKKRIARDDFKIRCDIWPLFVIFQKAASWTAEEYSYDLDTAVNFTGGWLPEVKCSLCDSNKHQNADCSETKIPPLVTIAYERPVEEDQKLTEMIHEVCQRKMMTPERIESILQIVKQLEDILRPVFPDVRLDLFGSLYNGFGTTASDADICFRFASDTPPEGVNVEETLCVVSRTLKKMYGSKIFIMNIMQAKVPIVKFNLKGETNKEPIFDGDISYYNSLALANTRMLYEYTKWDSRVAELGVWVKTWANSLFINDASKGSLSSYSYVVMTIHYLQELNPPVLPRLQEDFRNDAPPELQDEHDIYYYKNGWEKDEPWSKNTMSLSELFIGFLDFYSRYDYNNQVIQIRRSKPLSKLEKEWNKPICLEDPFDLKHNLGAVVNQRMFFFILKTFRKSREIFMNKVFFDSTYLDISNWLLNDCSMGRPPLLAKQCFYCGRMNHTRENCPRRIEAEKINADTRGGSDGKVRRDGRNQNQRGGGGRSLQNRDNGFRGKGPRRDI